MGVRHRRTAAAEVPSRTRTGRSRETRGAAVLPRQARRALLHTAKVVHVAERTRRARELVRESSTVRAVMAHGTSVRLRRIHQAIETGRASLARVVAELVLVSARRTRNRVVAAHRTLAARRTHEVVEVGRHRRAARTVVPSQALKLTVHSAVGRTVVPLHTRLTISDRRQTSRGSVRAGRALHRRRTALRTIVTRRTNVVHARVARRHASVAGVTQVERVRCMWGGDIGTPAAEVPSRTRASWPRQPRSRAISTRKTGLAAGVHKGSRVVVVSTRGTWKPVCTASVQRANITRRTQQG